MDRETTQRIFAGFLVAFFIYHLVFFSWFGLMFMAFDVFLIYTIGQERNWWLKLRNWANQNAYKHGLKK